MKRSKNYSKRSRRVSKTNDVIYSQKSGFMRNPSRPILMNGKIMRRSPFFRKHSVGSLKSSPSPSPSPSPPPSRRPSASSPPSSRRPSNPWAGVGPTGERLSESPVFVGTKTREELDAERLSSAIDLRTPSKPKLEDLIKKRVTDRRTVISPDGKRKSKKRKSKKNDGKKSKSKRKSN